LMDGFLCEKHTKSALFFRSVCHSFIYLGSVSFFCFCLFVCFLNWLFQCGFLWYW
jgi:hypothetical protein